MARFAVIGGGPAGLMAAEVLAEAGRDVTVFEAMPTMGRKLLMAGKSGLNITHAESHGQFAERYGASTGRLGDALAVFDGVAVRTWCAGLGVETFVGSSGRVFPEAMKASPLLRAWLARLAGAGVRLAPRYRWLGFEGEDLKFAAPEGSVCERFDAVVLALGGASWPRLGSDAKWVPRLERAGVNVSRFRPANCGFDVDWDSEVTGRFTGSPVKAVLATSDAGTSSGEFVLSRTGIEGSLVYMHSAALRDRLERDGTAIWTLDLAPGRDVVRLAVDLGKHSPKLSLSNRLRKGGRLDPVKSALLRRHLSGVPTGNWTALAERIKALPLKLVRPRPVEEAISSTGGVAWEEVGENFMLHRLPGVFVAGEMIDWEAPTGGYLLTACLATGRAAAKGAIRWCDRQER